MRKVVLISRAKSSLSRSLLCGFFLCSFLLANASTHSFNKSWQFVNPNDTTIRASLFSPKDAGLQWEGVSLPHTAEIVPYVTAKRHWQGYSFYRKFFNVPASAKGKHLAVRFDAAMQVAEIYLNGKKIDVHEGGYLPFYVDLTNLVRYGEENCLLVRLNNLNNALVPPGKTLETLDFNYYSGIYRDAHWIETDLFRISDSSEKGFQAADGGVMVTFPKVSAASASVQVAVDLKNDASAARSGNLQLELKDKAGKVVASANVTVAVGALQHKVFSKMLDVKNPRLWSPDAPNRYQLVVKLVENKKIIDSYQEKIGIRTVAVDAQKGLLLNGKPVHILGTNRHQEYPYIGNALSNNAQYRDALKIKQAGFNYVRTSHYPQSSAFLDACDELGIMVMDCMPGWQYFGNEVFQQNALQSIRDMVRRDRNHPSIVMWEASINETGMPRTFMQKAVEAVHQTLPGQNVLTAGWIDDVYDIFIPARQHKNAPDYWKIYDRPRPIMMGEYGDWEYYAMNAGFNQTEFKDLKGEERTSRQLRGHGQQRLLQQALNYQEAHNDNFRGRFIGDANWLMFDYNRGYASDIESSGIIDLVRLPKYAFYFYQSQQHAKGKPMIFVANHWCDPNYKTVKVYSNCDEVELWLNGKLIERRKPDTDANSDHLKHAPFTFQPGKYEAGTLVAKGLIKGKTVVEDVRRTAGLAQGLSLSWDESGRKLQAGCNDVVFVYARVTDANGTMLPTDAREVSFTVEGDAQIVGPALQKAEAGIATILLKAGEKAGNIRITARSAGLQPGVLNLQAVK